MKKDKITSKNKTLKIYKKSLYMKKEKMVHLLQKHYNRSLLLSQKSPDRQKNKKMRQSKRKLMGKDRYKAQFKKRRKEK